MTYNAYIYIYIIILKESACFFNFIYLFIYFFYFLFVLLVGVSVSDLHTGELNWDFPYTSVVIYHSGESLSEQHTDLPICYRTKQDLSRTSSYLGIT